MTDKPIKIEYENGETLEIPQGFFVAAAEQDLESLKIMKEISEENPLLAKDIDWDAMIGKSEKQLAKAKEIEANQTSK